MSGRYQSWGYDEAGWRDNQLTFGVTHLFTSMTSFMFNFDTYLPDEGDNKHGMSMYLQVMFLISTVLFFMLVILLKM